MTNKVLAIGSGKEVMDKTTVAVNLAVAFSNWALEISLLGADIDAPSISIMLDLKN
ncbi:P-loop NTPase [Candidatus Protochlamydia amoebophila]|uniref:CobQ/CobB/MinD/ParA nucleotide binding domain-containing protein n=1 Tax=Candidatus Protochlamydia amoebophila TaxID=362787 RepID=A0A0C1JL39_9BACT|nr:P-loop NTPase [Candidatus Protochlamydia amoebophila]KIC71296.1 hypothetical protein DB44_DZ00090 [Candidatus Protochlamydia amoebophila]